MLMRDRDHTILKIIRCAYKGVVKLTSCIAFVGWRHTNTHTIIHKHLYTRTDLCAVQERHHSTTFDDHHRRLQEIYIYIYFGLLLRSVSHQILRRKM